MSLGLKVYPEGGYSHHDEIPHYLWRIGIRRNQTENFRLYDFHVQLVDPSKHHELNGIKYIINLCAMNMNIGICTYLRR